MLEEEKKTENVFTWSWLSAYPTHFSPHLRLVRVWTMWPISQSSSRTSFRYLIHMSGTAIASR